MAPKTPGPARRDPPVPPHRALSGDAFTAIERSPEPSMLPRHMATKKKAKVEELEAESPDADDEVALDDELDVDVDEDVDIDDEEALEDIGDDALADDADDIA